MRVTFVIEGDAPKEKLEEIVAAGRRPLRRLDMVTNGIPVSIVTQRRRD